jgi:hypothetical protein
MWESLEEADMVLRRNERVRKARVRRDDQILDVIAHRREELGACLDEIGSDLAQG